MKRVVISTKCLPTRSPFSFLIIVSLLMERGAGVPDWAWGVYWTVAFLLMAIYTAMVWDEESEVVPGFGEMK